MNTNQSHTTKSTQELRQQIMSDIDRVKDDFNEIKHRLTPGQIIDDAIYYRRGGGDPAATFEFLKHNPIGTSFLTLGTLLLMEDSSHISIEERARLKVSDVRTKYSGTINEYKVKAQDIKTKVSDKIDTMRAKKEDVKIKYSETVDKVKSATDSLADSSGSMNASGIDSAMIGERARELKDTTTEKIGDVKSKLSSVKESVVGRGQEAIERVKHLDPLTYLVLGAGLGTITGAALPVTEAEDRMLQGEARDRFSTFKQELEVALNESANILKNEFIGGVTKFNISIF